MAYCYCCNATLDDANRSVEHIFPNAVGGRFRSKELLCKACNSLLADIVDAPLVEQFSGITTILDINRERGAVPAVEGTLPDGTEITMAPGGKPAIKHPVYQETTIDGGKQIHFQARTEKEMAAFITSMVKKYPQIDPNQMAAAVLRGTTYLREPMKIPFKFGGETCFRGALKIALQSHIVWVGKPRNHGLALRILMGDGEPNRFVCFSQGFDAFGADKGNIVTHSISLFGSRQQRIVYATVTLFSFIRLLVLLDDAYGGEDFLHAYVQDSVSGTPLQITEHNTLTRDQVEALRNSGKWPPNGFHSELNRVVAVGMNAMKTAEMQRIFKECLGEWGTKHEGKLITPEMVHELQTAYRAALERSISPVTKSIRDDRPA